ncbi:MAG TPA: c-type cytochrome [Burkholderiales bacterium]|jgi:cytochrome c
MAQAADPERGKALYESRCSGCHSLDQDRVGPRHRGVVGRKAGSVAGFEYSAALRASRVVWSAKTLDAWLANPERLIPGQRMNYSVPDDADRAALIAYLTQPAAAAR